MRVGKELERIGPGWYYTLCGGEVGVLNASHQPSPYSLDEITTVVLEMCLYSLSFFFFFFCLLSDSSSFEKSCFTPPKCFGQSPWVRTATDAATGCCPVWLVFLWKEQREV